MAKSNLTGVVLKVAALIAIVKDLINTPSTAKAELEALKKRSEAEITGLRMERDDLKVKLADEEADNEDVAALEGLLPQLDDVIDAATAANPPTGPADPTDTSDPIQPRDTNEVLDRPADGAGGTNEVTPTPDNDVKAVNPDTGEVLSDPVTGQPAGQPTE